MPRLILGRAYGPVRGSIRELEPGARVDFLVIDRELRSEERRIVVAGKPAELAGGLLVQMGQHIVVLPGPNDVDFYDRLSLHSSASRGKKLAWEGMAYD